MKIKETDFSGLLKNNFCGTPAILIYGPDQGKIRDFVDKIVTKLDIQSDNLLDADGMDFKDKFDMLFSDACSASMFGGDKLIVIRNPDGRDSSLVSKICECSSYPVVITCEELDSKSGLRKTFEEHERFACLPIYADDEQSLGALIRGELNKFGIEKIDNDAMSYMFQHLGKDRAIARSFLQKIALYVYDKKSISLDDVEKCLPDTGAANMDDFKYNLTAGYLTQTLRAMDRLFAENINTTMLTRVLNNHFKDLLGCVSGGQLPRVFWKYNSMFDTARRIWSEQELVAILKRLNKLELDLRSPADDEIMFRDFALKLATRAYKLSSTARTRK